MLQALKRPDLSLDWLRALTDLRNPLAQRLNITIQRPHEHLQPSRETAILDICDRTLLEAQLNQPGTQMCAELRSYCGEVQLHCHNHHQVVLPWRGVLEMEVAERGGYVMQGTGAFIVAGTTHAFCANSNNQFMVADIPDLDIAVLHRTAEQFLTSPFFIINAEIQGLLDFMVARMARTYGSDETFSSWGQLLIHSLWDGQGQLDRYRQKVEQALAFMREHLEQPLSVARIAVACGVSESRLYALFKETLGQSPHTVLSEMRIRCAKRLLVNTDLSIAEIAVRTGHADQSTLTRKLRMADDITPAAYRRNARRGLISRGSD